MMRRLAARARVATVAMAACVQLRSQAMQVPPRRPLHKFDNFLTGASANYFEAQYEAWKHDPASVEESLAEMFRAAEATENGEEPLFAQPPTRLVDELSLYKPKKIGIAQTLQQSRRLISLIQAHERDGHLFAQLDPLKYERGTRRNPALKQAMRVNLHPNAFGFVEEDFDSTFCVGFHDGCGGLFDANTGPMKLSDIYQRLKRAYTGTIGYEFMHIYDEKVCHWLRERIETPQRVPDSALSTRYTAADRKSMFEQLASAAEFELMLKTKFGTTKRFGSDGAESFIVGLEAAIERSTVHGVEDVVIGMAHRGRLSVLHHICGKPYEALLSEFKGVKESDVLSAHDYGDVKYHRGMRSTRTLRNGKTCAVELLNNPSHLETVNPVVQGFARAEQVARGDENGLRVLPIEVHGDAAAAGQGIVFETMGLASIGKFKTGGTIHVVVNNQVGFTTAPVDSRSSTHCTDVARVFQCPVFHVNGDSVEDVHRVFQLAADYRATFGRSVIIDLVCYRRYGHNEADTPSFTQPMLYKVIEKRRNIVQLYKEQLAESSGLESAELDTIHKDVKSKFRKAWAVVEEGKYSYLDFQKQCVKPEWADFMPELEDAKMFPTTVNDAALRPVISALKSLPQGFALHKTLQGIMQKRAESLDKGVGIEWGTAEALAFGTLLQEGFPIRISGQDVERATFSQRHAVVHDQNTDDTHTYLENVSEEQARFTVTNSSLSEYGVLGFEVGYALRNPKNMNIWEAQFADFANGAQIMIDQFVTSSESKWRQPSSVILSMPHGNDGNGPEHSSGRIERFLQANTETDELPIMGEVERHWRGTVEVAFPTTPKQYFHLLRRHMHRNFRKPLVIFFSKAWLRAPNVSTIEELKTGRFEPLLDTTPEDKVASVTRVVFTVGQVYHMLHAAIQEKNISNVALVRLEQLAPLPLQEIHDTLARYPNAQLVFAQEEPKNMGSFNFIEPHILRAGDFKRPVEFVGRLAGPSPATGYGAIWKHENAEIIRKALGL
eukprot:CAMPEP_0174830576 /NCGR_PEP_ID=MMETSP1114-20130205/2599_1 /TAXON_ID=312471 /ORGANISM="Neobodo designis, Strain CCAP 1951/1" /LENGTH=1005 /DNA_ID=CAMNT_0016064377 /DNA_START=32 /DNA_END=3049 /DNA_ORIENTATION=-